VVEVTLVGGELGDLSAVAQAVGNTDRELREARENVELRQCERRDPVHPDRVAKRDEIEPPAAPLAPGHRSEFAAEVTHALLVRAFDLRRERSLADSRHVRLRDAEDPVDPVGADTDSGGSVAGDRVRRRDERICAVVEIEERSLRTFQQNLAPLVQGAVDEQRRVGHVRTNPLGERLEVACDLLQVQRRNAVDPFEPHVLLRERNLDLLAEDLRVEQVLHTDSKPGGFVRVARPDATLRRADLQIAESPFARLVDRDVPRHDQVRLTGEMHGARREPAGLELVDLG
jgi:hypothetical protein